MTYPRKRLPNLIFIISLLVQSLLVSFGWPERAGAENLNPNLLQNPGFEQAAGAVPDHWQAMGGWGVSGVALSSQAHSGSRAASVSSGTLTNPWVLQKVPVEAGNTYEFSTWFKSSGVQGKGVVLKVEFYSSESGGAANWVFEKFGPYIRETTGDWQPYKFRLQAPEGAVVAVVYLRLWGTGTVLFDDAAVKLVNLTMSTDQIVYYSDVAEGRVRISNRFSDDVYTGKTIGVRITDAVYGMVIHSVYGLAAQPDMTLTFDPRGMSLNTPYEVETVLSASDQTVIDRASARIYRYNRPTSVPAGGLIRVDGEPFFPVIAYHADVEQYPLLHEIGVNTVQGVNAGTTTAIRQAMDSAHTNGLKVLFPLYYYMNITQDFAKMAQYVAEFKDHPALLAWMTIDEPSGNGVTVEQTAAAYAIVRALDPTHPVYTVEGDRNEYANYGRVPDVLTVDSYPLPNRPIANVGDDVRRAAEAAKSGRPVWSILQTFAYPPPSAWTYLPTITEVRNMAYQSLLAGATGLGYYALNDPGWSLADSALWPGLKQFAPELGLMADLSRLTPADHRNEDGVEWAVWDKEGELYVVAVNKTDQTKAVSIALPEIGYHAELLYGDYPASYDDPTGQLNVTLDARQASVFKLKPFRTMADQTFSLLGQAEELSSHPHWRNKVSRLAADMETIAEQLAGTAPDPNGIAAGAAKAVKTMEQLKSWIEGQSDSALGGNRDAMTSLLNQAIGKMSPLAAAQIGLRLDIVPEKAIGGNEVKVIVRTVNRGQTDVNDVAWTVRFPDFFQLPSASGAIGTLPGGQTYEKELTFAVPPGVSQAVYSAMGEVSFQYRGVRLNIGAAKGFGTSPLLETALEPADVTMTGPGNVPFSVRLTNRSGSAVTAELRADAPAEIGLSLPAAVPIQAGGSVTVQGSVYLNSANAADGAYTAEIRSSVGGYSFDTQLLTVNVKRNMVNNPGFEIAAANGSSPAGWNMGKGYWDAASAHGGARSVKLVPDSANSNNFIASSAIPLVPGKSYKLSGWLKHEATSGQVLFGVRYVNASGATISYQLPAVPASPDWTYREWPLAIPAGTMQVYVYFRMNQATNGQAWLDDVSLRESLAP
jgi:hypothetical protein